MIEGDTKMHGRHLADDISEMNIIVFYFFFDSNFTDIFPNTNNLAMVHIITWCSEGQYCRKLTFTVLYT